MEKCCTFAGHRTAPDTLKNELIKSVADLVEQGVTTFYVGNNGNFDALSASAVRAVKQQHKDIRLILVLPKMTSSVQNHRDYYSYMYDEILIPTQSDEAHFKAMITLRNKWMVDNSDYIITYIRKEIGGAYNTFRYAKTKSIRIIEISKKKA